LISLNAALKILLHGAVQELRRLRVFFIRGGKGRASFRVSCGQPV
jgi:hypothetical protein